ncbi:putative mitochondrial protein AtMg00310 [Apium graveolens]|uniref:putative mitochondrial protein AtMg00310 n=1 Tax=Apium graveolens TaxID=4045 RepID=UPI003D7AFC61
MSVFLLPFEITKDLERSISRFWWNSKTNDNMSIHWMSWDRLSRHKSAGGMGFRDFRDFNLAMHGKQAWRFITNPNSLATRLYKARYFPNNSFMEANIGNNPSFVRRSIWEAKQVISAGMRWKIGSGNAVDIIGQPWLLDDNNPFITSDIRGLKNHKVSALMVDNQREWDEEILRDMFNDRDQQCIRRIRPNVNENDDVMYWGEEATGQYTVRSTDFYKLRRVFGGKSTSIA